MAKDKEFEKEYKEIRAHRTALRKQKRKDHNQYKLHRYGRQSEGTCPDCGGQMTWCSCCEVWSRSCCVEYGTCQCS